MTDPDIERLAKQSGLYISAELRIFAALIEAHALERAARIAETVHPHWIHIAAAIRALKEPA